MEETHKKSYAKLHFRNSTRNFFYSKWDKGTLVKLPFLLRKEDYKILTLVLS